MCLRQHVEPYKPLFCCGCLLDFELFFWKLDTSCLLKENEKGRKIKGGKVRKQTDLMFVFGFGFLGVYSFFFKSKIAKDKINGSERHIQLFQNCEMRRRGERAGKRKGGRVTEKEESLLKKRAPLYRQPDARWLLLINIQP